MGGQNQQGMDDLSALRAKIDAIDESVHRLLMQRASVIDQLIAVKGTAKNGAAFRPAREAAMMRELATRHSGHLPVTAIEHVWREVISTFTALQAPFEVYTVGGPGVVDAVEAARFYCGFSVPLHVLDTPQDAVTAIEEGGDRLGIVPIGASDRAWWQGLQSAGIVARLPFFEADARPAATPALMIAPPLADPTPPEIRCFVVDGLSGMPEPAPGRSVIAEAPYGTDTFSAIVATRMDADALAGTLDGAATIRAIGGYAEPLRVAAPS